MTEETKIGDKYEYAENERWSSYAMDEDDGTERWSSYAMDDDDGTSSGMDHSLSPDLGSEWKNWRVEDPGFESDESAEDEVSERKRLKYDVKATWRSAECADD